MAGPGGELVAISGAGFMQSLSILRVERALKRLAEHMDTGVSLPLDDALVIEMVLRRLVGQARAAVGKKVN